MFTPLLGHPTVQADPPVVVPDIPLSTGQVILPDGWKISPVGHSTRLSGDLPLRMILTPDQKYLVVSNGGYNEHGVTVLDAKTGDVVDRAKVPQTYVGMCMDSTGQHIQLSPGGAKAPATLYSFALHEGHLTPETGQVVPAVEKKRKLIGGLACDSNGITYFADVNDDRVYRTPTDGSKAISAKVGYHACAISLSPDDKVLAVANWGDQSVALLNSQDLTQTGRIVVGSHPSDLAWGTDGRLFVSNAGGNTVSVINTKTPAVTETIRTSLDFQVPVGSTPIALAVNHANTRLYVANADNNDVAVVDISKPEESKVLGFIPTGWYPSAIAVSGDDKMIYIGVGKGLNFAPNPDPKTYIGTLLSGYVSMVPDPTPAALEGFTRQVLANTPLPQSNEKLEQRDAATLVGAFHKIKHVIYIIKENRTYDQVFGDLPQGNGDPNLVMFGRKITPNEHAIAQQWVLLDNLYCNGEVSQDGHAWCDAAYANDFTEKSWLNGYSKRAEPEDDGRSARSPGGYIWDVAVEHHLTFRTFGEGANFVASPETAPDVDDSKTREEFLCREWKGGIGVRDTSKMQIFLKELADAEKTGKWPNLMVMALPEDHTYGRQAGKLTPEAMVASNDQAVGQLVDAVTHSRFWPETAIFIIEDDAQNGHDHVDAHRTEGLVISPYTRRSAVDHTMYTTASMIRTIELMLDLPPMTQYDAAATPMFRSFTSEANLKPYNALKPETDLAAKNPAKGKGAVASAELDFSDVDRADPDKLNAILWDYFKPGTPEPAPVRSLVLVR